MDLLRTDPARPARRRATAGLLAVIAGGIAAPVLGQQSADPLPVTGAYTVEIILFRGGGGAAGEDLSVPARNLSQDSDSAAADTARSAHLGEVLPAARHKLNDVAARLNASGSHRVIAHVAWTQTASAWNSGAGIAAEQLGLTPAGVTGVVHLERGQYLHLGFNLTYAPAGGARVVLQEMRRIRFGERNYFDHPALGIIALVTPTTAP